MKRQTSTTTVPASRPEPASLQLVLYPHSTLKKIARDVQHFDDWLRAVVERMKDLMVEHKGVGLAAPQVGLSLRLFVASPTAKREDAKAYINPVLTDEEGNEEGEEGCLSLPDIRIKVPRFTSLRIEALDVDGQPFAENLTDYPARIMQHENDHLDGILLLDRMSPVARLANRRKIKDLEESAKGKRR
ncbi:MAG TPA: peptide deformylase [Phycisphaerae bacterium]|nr:peptide deformylase [Phycisphaerae bacterium]